MDKGCIYIYTGEGRGKSCAAIGRAVCAAACGKQTVIIDFLKNKKIGDSEFLRRMEPEIKWFHFEKSEENFEMLSEEKKQEEAMNIKNGLHFARKVLSTGGCDLLILDEVLGLIDNGIITVEKMKEFLDMRGTCDVVLTGVTLCDEVCSLADEVSRIETVEA